MATEVRLTREDSKTPWGFRLTGGVNFKVPLIVIKVVENSIAAITGLTVGDIIAMINGNEIGHLTHAQAHDVIIQSKNELLFTIVRGEISDIIQSLINEEQTNDEVFNLLEQSIPIDYPEKTIDDLIKDTQMMHDLNLTDEEIHNIIDPDIVTSKTKPQTANNDPPPVKLQPVEDLQSAVIAEINHTLREQQQPSPKKWSTFLQKPKNVIPFNQPQFPVQKSTYRVVIRTKKDLEAEREAKRLQLETEALKAQEIAESVKTEVVEEEEEYGIDDISSDSDFTFSDSSNATESTITFTPSGTEPTLSYTESLASLEEKLERVKEQLQIYNIELVPEALQKTLTKIAAQLERIVKVVKPQPLTSDATENDIDEYWSDDDSSSSLSSLDSHISTPTASTPTYEGTEPTLTFSSYTIMSDPPSASTPEGTEQTLTFSDDDERADHAECDRTECDATEIDDYQEAVMDTQQQHHQQVVGEEKTCKKDKADNMEPLTRPIILPGGRKWCAPDDAGQPSPAAAARRHASLTDERIEATISSFYEKIDGKTVEHWNRIWPWTRVTQPIYRESNCCKVASKMSEEHKINFMKYNPAPVNLDHLKNSEVYKMVHNPHGDEGLGIFGRPERVVPHPGMNLDH